jgi:hypothetical protein
MSNILKNQNNTKKQLLDPLGSMCHIVSLAFKPVGAKMGINNHAIVINEYNYLQWLDRYWNGDTRENIGLLFNIIIRIIEWYVIPLSKKYNNKTVKFETIQIETLSDDEKTLMWSCLEKMCNFMCMAFDRLQRTYFNENVPTNVILATQFFINIIKDSLNGHYSRDKLPKCFFDIDTKTFLDYNKIKSLWNADRLQKICDLYEKCMKVYNSSEKTKDEQIISYMTAIDRLINIYDNEFRELLNLGNEGQVIS